VSGSLDHTIRIWEAETGEEVTRMAIYSSVNSVAFSPDGKYVLTGSGDYTVRLWDVTTGEELARMNHDSNVRSVAFSPDGKYAVSASRDQTARVWEVETRQEVTRIFHSSRLNSVTFSPDGKYLTSGSEDNIVRVWVWRPEDLIEKACSRLTRSLNRDEWQQYLGNEPYQAVCPNLPIAFDPITETLELYILNNQKDGIIRRSCNINRREIHRLLYG
jgi:WD40 repeat protein